LVSQELETTRRFALEQFSKLSLDLLVRLIAQQYEFPNTYVEIQPSPMLDAFIDLREKLLDHTITMYMSETPDEGQPAAMEGVAALPPVESEPQGESEASAMEGVAALPPANLPFVPQTALDLPMQPVYGEPAQPDIISSRKRSASSEDDESKRQRLMMQLQETQVGGQEPWLDMSKIQRGIMMLLDPTYNNIMNKDYQELKYVNDYAALSGFSKKYHACLEILGDCAFNGIPLEAYWQAVGNEITRLRRFYTHGNVRDEIEALWIAYNQASAAEEARASAAEEARREAEAHASSQRDRVRNVIMHALTNEVPEAVHALKQSMVLPPTGPSSQRGIPASQRVAGGYYLPIKVPHMRISPKKKRSLRKKKLARKSRKRSY
jgi:hypothetical protein